MINQALLTLDSNPGFLCGDLHESIGSQDIVIYWWHRLYYLYLWVTPDHKIFTLD